MRLTQVQIERLVRKVFDELKKTNIVTFKSPEGAVFQRAVELVGEEFQEERNLDQEVTRMLDKLEAENPNSFDRGKMRGLLKRKLAKDKGIIL